MAEGVSSEKKIDQRPEDAHRVASFEKARHIASSAKGWRDSAAEMRVGVGADHLQHLDKRADRVEKWAGALFDHPISVSFRDQHPEVSFTAESLAKLDEETEQKLEEANKLAKILPGIHPGNVLEDFISGRFREEMESVYGELDRPSWRKIPDNAVEVNTEKWKEYRSLLGNPETTLQQLKDFWEEVVVKTRVEKVREQVASERSLLDDVESGRVSEEHESGQQPSTPQQMSKEIPEYDGNYLRKNLVDALGNQSAYDAAKKITQIDGFPRIKDTETSQS